MKPILIFLPVLFFSTQGLAQLQNSKDTNIIKYSSFQQFFEKSFSDSNFLIEATKGLKELEQKRKNYLKIFKRLNSDSLSTKINALKNYSIDYLENDSLNIGVEENAVSYSKRMFDNINDLSPYLNQRTLAVNCAILLESFEEKDPFKTSVAFKHLSNDVYNDLDSKNERIRNYVAAFDLYETGNPATSFSEVSIIIDKLFAEDPSFDIFMIHNIEYVTGLYESELSVRSLEYMPDWQSFGRQSKHFHKYLLYLLQTFPRKIQRINTSDFRPIDPIDGKPKMRADNIPLVTKSNWFMAVFYKECLYYVTNINLAGNHALNLINIIYK